MKEGLHKGVNAIGFHLHEILEWQNYSTVKKLRAMTVVTSGRVEARTDWEQAQGSF